GLAASADARSLVSGGVHRGQGELPMFGELTVWDLAAGQPKLPPGGAMRDQMTRRLFPVTSAINAVAMSTEGRLVVSACADGTVTAWDVGAAREKLYLE